MVSPTLLTELGQLSHTDKIRVIQFLVGQVANEEGITEVFNGTYEVWSPQITPEGLKVLTDLLSEADDTP